MTSQHPSITGKQESCPLIFIPAVMMVSLFSSSAALQFPAPIPVVIALFLWELLDRVSHDKLDIPPFQSFGNDMFSSL